MERKSTERTIKITSIIAAALAALTLTSCSAYGNPSKYVNVPGKGEVTISAAEVAKKRQEQIDSLLESKREELYTKVEDSAAVVQKGDQVAIVYTGTPVDTELKLDDKVIAGMTNKAEEGKEQVYENLVIGSDKFITEYTSTEKPELNNKGFEDQLIGKKAGETVTVTVTFPDAYDTTALQGVPVNFVVEINSISRNIIDDKSTVTVSYSFENKTGVTVDSEDTESTVTAFTTIFKTGTFDVSYDETSTASFNDIFKVADYAAKFTGKQIYYSESVDVTVPSDNEKYSDYAGKTVGITFTVTKVTTLPEWNDEFVATATTDTYKTVDEYIEALDKSIKESLAVEALIEAAEVTSYPKSELKKVYKDTVDSLVSSKLSGSNPSDFTPSELAEKLTDEVYAEIYASAASTAYQTVKERLVLEYLIDELDIKLSNSEYKEKLQEFTDQMNAYYSYYSSAASSATTKDMEKSYGKAYLKYQFSCDKLYEVVVDYVTLGE